MDNETTTTPVDHGHGEELMELSHEPVPGYRKIFFITMAVAVLYLAIVLIQTY